MTTAPGVLVSVHDVAPSTRRAAQRWLHDLDQRGVPATLLVVGGPWRGPAVADDPDTIAWLRTRQDAGDEIALHGWAHRAVVPGTLARRVTGAVAARGCAEFWALDETAARQRLDRSFGALRAVGLDADGFTPPGWLASPGTFRAARRLGLRYLATHLRVHDLRGHRTVRAPALCHRPGGAGERLGAALLAYGTARRARHGRTTRVALHPDDLDRPGLRDVALGAIDAALDAGAEPQTYRDALVTAATAPQP